MSQQGAVQIINRKLKQTDSGDLGCVTRTRKAPTRPRLHVRNFNAGSEGASTVTHHKVLASPLALVPLGQRGGPGDLRRGMTERNTTQLGSAGGGERRDAVWGVSAVSQSDRGQIRLQGRS